MSQHYKFSAAADLGWAAGGVYHLTACRRTNFFSNYTSKYDTEFQECAARSDLFFVQSLPAGQDLPRKRLVKSDFPGCTFNGTV